MTKQEIDVPIVVFASPYPECLQTADKACDKVSHVAPPNRDSVTFEKERHWGKFGYSCRVKGIKVV